MLLALPAACGGEDPLPARRQPTGAVCGSSTQTYATFAAPLLAQYCTSCHSSALVGAARSSAPAGLDFDTLTGVRAAASAIDRVAGSGPDADNTDMPPGSPRPSLEARAQLASWLACGAP
jgi:uncharacterized membrane protein